MPALCSVISFRLRSLSRVFALVETRPQLIDCKQVTRNLVCFVFLRWSNVREIWFVSYFFVGRTSCRSPWSPLSE